MVDGASDTAPARRNKGAIGFRETGRKPNASIVSARPLTVARPVEWSDDFVGETTSLIQNRSGYLVIEVGKGRTSIEAVHPHN
jgi:hypothetical protein